jgi:phospholipase C
MAGTAPLAQQIGGPADPSGADADTLAQEPKVKKSRTNTPWTAAEEQRLKQMRDAGNSWSEIAKVQNDSCPHHTHLRGPRHTWLDYPSRRAV